MVVGMPGYEEYVICLDKPYLWSSKVDTKSGVILSARDVCHLRIIQIHRDPVDIPKHRHVALEHFSKRFAMEVARRDIAGVQMEFLITCHTEPFQPPSHKGRPERFA